MTQGMSTSANVEKKKRHLDSISCLGPSELSPAPLKRVVATPTGPRHFHSTGGGGGRCAFPPVISHSWAARGRPADSSWTWRGSQQWRRRCVCGGGEWRGYSPPSSPHPAAYCISLVTVMEDSIFSRTIKTNLLFGTNRLASYWREQNFIK